MMPFYALKNLYSPMSSPEISTRSSNRNNTSQFFTNEDIVMIELTWLMQRRKKFILINILF
jgi:hypothetical protein